MCGIAGLLLHEPGPVGESLVKMCEAMRHRGADSTGFALYGEPDPSRLIVRARHPDASRALADAEHVVDAVRDLGGDLHDEIAHDDQAGAADRFLRFQLRYTGDIKVGSPGTELEFAL